MDNVVWMICKNEEFYIDMAIASVIHKVGGIFILDTGSMDKTLYIIDIFKQCLPDKVVVEQGDFGGDFRFGSDDTYNEDRSNRQIMARDYAMKRATEIFNPKKFLIQLDADEIYNDRFFEILDSVEGDCLGHATNILLTPYTVSNHPLDLEVWDGVKLFDPHVRAWKANLPVHWKGREGRHVVPRIDGIGDYLALPNRVVTSDYVHFHLHRSFGPKCKEVDGNDLASPKCKKFEVPLIHPLPDYVVNRWRKWEQDNG